MREIERVKRFNIMFFVYAIVLAAFLGWCDKIDREQMTNTTDFTREEEFNHAKL